jgi:nicotinate-nucleotide--dimethylbenzimidazole phosphoribosyltransferase
VNRFAGIEAFLFDVGDTLVEQQPPGTPLAELRARPLPGAVEALRELSGSYALGAVTNTAVMRETEVRALLGSVGLDELLEAVVSSVDVGAAKPDPAPLLEAAARLGVAPERCAFIGDGPEDLAAASAAGMHFAATDRGVPDALERLRGRRAGRFGAARSALRALDERAAGLARARQDQLTKPPGSLGQLEEIGVQLTAITGSCPPPPPAPAAVAVFAADHGVARAGVTPWPQEVTAQMVANFSAGGAAINAIAAQVGASVHVVDVGVAADLSGLEAVLHRKIMRGTEDLDAGPAMSSAQACAALGTGAEVAAMLVADGAGLLVTGEMGIGSTTASAAVIAALTGADAQAVTGRGTGIDDTTLARKREIVAGAIARARGLLDPCSVLAEVGGLEIGALAGFALGGAAAGVPVLCDGVIALAGLLLAERLAPGTSARCIAGHRSTEPGATVALEELAMRPLLELDLRLGEGTGAALAVPIVQASARIMNEMATFEQAAVSERD